MNTEVILKNFSDLQVFCLNSNRVAPSKRFDSFGPDNDKTWRCEICFADENAIQRVMTATASKKDLVENLALLKVAKFLNDEKKSVKQCPNCRTDLGRKAIYGSILQKLDLILQVLDPHALITSHLLNSGDVETNPGPSVALAGTCNTIQNYHDIDLDPLYPEDVQNLDDLLLVINGLIRPDLESIKDYQCELSYYQTYFALPNAYAYRVESALSHLSFLAADIHVNQNYERSRLLLSGDVESNPGPNKPQQKREMKKVDRELKKINKKLRVPMKNPVVRTKGNVRAAINRSNYSAAIKRKNIDTNYVKAVEAIALPACDNDFRWPSQFTSEKTGVANVYERPDVGFCKGAAVPPNSPFPDTDAFAIIQKIPECGTIVLDQNADLKSWEYVFSFKGAGTIGNAATYGTSGLMRLENDGDFTPLKLIQGTVNSSYAPHTTHWYAAQHSDTPALRYIWMNQGDEFDATFQNNAVSPTTFTWNVTFADGDGDPFDNELTASGAIASAGLWNPNYVAGKDGYYAFTFAASQSVNAGVSGVTVSGEGYVFCHRAIPSFDTNIAKIDSNRILGAAVMMTENASVTNMQGKIRIAQIPKDRNWYDFVGKFDEFSGLKGTEKFDAITGVYGFIKPTSAADFEFRSYHSTNGNTITDSYWPIKLDSASTTEKIIVYARITNSDGQDMYWTFAYAMEYRSNDQFVALDVSSIDVPAANRALEVIKNMPQFYENPLHVTDIVRNMRNGLKRVINGTIKYGPQVAKIAKDYGPTALKIATTLASVI